MSKDNDALALLKALRELCYRDNTTVDLLRKYQKLANSKRDPSKTTTVTFVEVTKMEAEVFKAAGDSILSKAMIEYIFLKAYPDKNHKNADFIAWCLTAR